MFDTETYGRSRTARECNGDQSRAEALIAAPKNVPLEVYPRPRRLYGCVEWRTLAQANGAGLTGVFDWRAPEV